MGTTRSPDRVSWPKHIPIVPGNGRHGTIPAKCARMSAGGAGPYDCAVPDLGQVVRHCQKRSSVSLGAAKNPVLPSRTNDLLPAALAHTTGRPERPLPPELRCRKSPYRSGIKIHPTKHKQSSAFFPPRGQRRRCPATVPVIPCARDRRRLTRLR